MLSITAVGRRSRIRRVRRARHRRALLRRDARLHDRARRARGCARRPDRVVRDGDVITIDVDARVLQSISTRTSSRAGSRTGGCRSCRTSAVSSAATGGSSALRPRARPRLMQALVVTPGREGSARVDDRRRARGGRRRGARPRARGRACAAPTARSRTAASAPRPRGRTQLVIGHELLGVVERDGAGLRARRARRRHRATLMRPLPRVRRGLAGLVPHRRLRASAGSRASTASRRSSSPRTRASSFPIPPSLGRLGVLAEPTSICARALRHAQAIGGRQPWQLRARSCSARARSGC